MSEQTQSTAGVPEAVHLVKDEASGLDGVIVLHSTVLGPAAGGCRAWRYPDSRAMTRDALRLAEGMAFKNAMADLPLGGGKSVINLPAEPFDRRALFEAFGRAVAELGGSYVTAEDVGTGVEDMEAVRRQTRHVAGLTKQEGRPGGDPSPWTALGVFLSMQEAVRRAFGGDLCGVTVAVQGLGHTGAALCRLLHEAGARLIVAETRSDVAAQIACRYGAEIASPRAILSARADVFAPCAMGGVLDGAGVGRLRARVVCGSANNVLARAEDGDALARRGVLYAPDYVVNAGGIVNVCAEYLGWDSAQAERRVRETGQRLAAVLDHAQEHGLAPHRAADLLARRRLERRAGDARPVAA